MYVKKCSMLLCTVLLIVVSLVCTARAVTCESFTSEAQCSGVVTSAGPCVWNQSKGCVTDTSVLLPAGQVAITSIGDAPKEIINIIDGAAEVPAPEPELK